MVNLNSFNDKEQFINKFFGSEEALKSLSIERLLQLEKYYNNIINENNQKIMKLVRIKNEN